MSADKMRLSFNTCKSLSIHLGEDAGKEIVNLLALLVRKIEFLERNNSELATEATCEGILSTLPEIQSETGGVTKSLPR